MASCYFCGRYGADYRRNVTTGTSRGTHYGKNITFSTRTYEGLRSLCEDCALSLDKGRVKQKIFTKYVVVIILLLLIYYFKIK